MYINDLKSFFKNKLSVRINSIQKFANKYPNQYKELLQDYKKYQQIFDFRIFVLLIIKDKLNSFCQICGKQLNYNQIRNNCKYCSLKCSSHDQTVRKKYKQTCVEKYGVQFPSQNKDVYNKIKQTNLQRYGTESPMQNQLIKQKIKQTNLQKYGCQYGLQNKDVKAKKVITNLQKYGCQYGLQNELVKSKIKKTNLQRYGVQNVFQNQQIKNRIKQTNLEKYGHQYVMQNQNIQNKKNSTNLQKYGVQYVFQNQQIKNRIKQTNLEKYGCQNPFQNQQIKNRIKQTNLEKYGVEHILQSEQYCQKVQRKNLDAGYDMLVKHCLNYVQPLFNKQQYYGANEHIYTWRCIKCGNIFKQRIYMSRHLGFSSYIPRCMNCYPYNSGESILQQKIREFIESLKVDFIVKDKTVIPPYQLDIFIPQKKIALEFNGLYWHNEFKKNKNYHLMKTQKCIEKGIQLIHIFQDQWLYKQEIVKDRIKNVLGIYDNRIYARKCIIKEIQPSVCKQFLDNNHIQGNDNSKIRLGLFYQNQLISVMTFNKPRFNKNYEYELVRFASKLGYQVIGGASKLLKYFQRNYRPKSLISYADRRYSNGKLYYALSLKFLNNSEPNYWWYKKQIKYSRYKCQKYRLKNILRQNFNPQLSESENMYNNGYNKIYDCGNMVFIKNY